MRCAAALSTTADTRQAVEEVCTRARESLPDSADLALVFFSADHAEAAEQIAATVQQRLSPRCLLSCVGESIVGNDQEVEQTPAMSLWLGHWPRRVQFEPFHLELERTPDGRSLLGWPDSLLNADPAQSAILLLGDPFTFPVNAFL